MKALSGERGTVLKTSSHLCSPGSHSTLQPPSVPLPQTPNVTYAAPCPEYISFRPPVPPAPQNALSLLPPRPPHMNKYQAEKFQNERRSSERTIHYDEHGHREYSHSEKHRSDSDVERRDQNRSPNSRKQESTSFEETLTESELDENEELLRIVCPRCTIPENYYSSDPMDLVGDSTVVGTSKYGPMSWRTCFSGLQLFADKAQ
ncbi:ribonuclease 3-like [Ambystoma mexicanum]|uniref:ribonuclease 3-like n=1 Tax=Ambystoma mexicanum TaxID=8296 RepID=UPI0037E7015F